MELGQKLLGINGQNCHCIKARRFRPFAALLPFSLLLAPVVAGANENWERFFGGVDGDTSLAISAFADGGLISAGYTRSSGKGDADIQLLRLDKSGKLLWEKTFGGVARDMATGVVSLPDGGFVTAAVSHQNNDNQGDALIMRNDKNGNSLWQKHFGGGQYDIPYAVEVTREGHIVVVGYTKSGGKGDADGWVFRLDGKGKKLWERTFGTPGRDWLRSLAIMPNGDIVVAGGSKAETEAETHAWVMRLDKNGKKLWEHIFKDADNVARSVVPFADNTIAIAGWVHEKNSATSRDIWITRLDAKGNMVWEKKFGGAGDDQTEALIALPGGDIALAGGTTKNLAVITVKTAWMLRLDDSGKLVWRHTFEGKSDQLFGLAPLPDGNIAACGTSWQPKGGADAWIFTVDKDGQPAKPIVLEEKSKASLQ